MAGTTNSSFIPKNANRSKRKVRTTKRIYLLSYLSYVFFFGTLVATLGVFFYSVQVGNSLQTAQETLNVEKNRFSIEQIDGVRTLDARINTAEELLADLRSPSRIFTDIEALIAENVYLTGFTYKKENNGTFSLELEGRARALGPVLFQRDLFKRAEIFRNADIATFDYAVNSSSDDEGESDTEAAAVISSLLSDEPPVITFNFVARPALSLIEYVPIIEEAARVETVPPTEVIATRPVDEAAVVPDEEVVTTEAEGVEISPETE